MSFRSEDRDPGSRGNSLNMEKGTVIDGSFINSPRGNGFYLCSHKGILGTSKPAYYEIRFNEWNVEPEKLSDVLQVLFLAFTMQVPSLLANHLLVVLYAPAERSNAFITSTGVLRPFVVGPSGGVSKGGGFNVSLTFFEPFDAFCSRSDLYPHRNVQHSTYFT